MTMTTDLASRHAELSRELASLRDRRPQLALAVTQGGAATTTLDELEAAIAAGERELERLSLAERESDRLAAIDRQQAAAAEGRRLEAAYQEAAATRQTAYRAVEAAMAELVNSIEGAVAAGDDQSRVGDQIGRPSVVYATRLDLTEYVLSQLWTPLSMMLPAPGRVWERLAEPVGGVKS